MEENNVRLLIAVTKKNGGEKLLVPSIEGYKKGYTVDGIYVEQDGVARIFAPTEAPLVYGIDSQNLPAEDKHYEEIIPSFGGVDGESSTDTLISIYQLGEGTAAVEARGYGWLPEAGEFDLIANNLEAYNALCAEVSGATVEGRYWLSQRRNADYPWFYEVGQGLGSWLGGVNQLKVRPCMSADGYEVVE